MTIKAGVLVEYIDKTQGDTVDDSFVDKSKQFIVKGVNRDVALIKQADGEAEYLDVYEYLHKLRIVEVVVPECTCATHEPQLNGGW